MPSSRGRADGQALRWTRAVVVAALAGLLTCGLFAKAHEALTVTWLPRQPTLLEVGRPGAWASGQALRDAAHWTVRVVNSADGSVTELQPKLVEVDDRLGVVTLFMRDVLRPFDEARDLQDVSVRYAEGIDTAEGHVPSFKDRMGFVAARGRSEADLYLSGALATGRDSKPTYAAEVKLRQRYARRSGGELSVALAGVAAKERNIDPDSITGAVAYRPASKLLGGYLEWSLLSGEFARRTDVRTLTSNARLTWATPARSLHGPARAAAEPFVGFEAGRNLTRADVSGDRAVFRPLLGANLYLLALAPVAGLNRITLAIEFTLRLPQTDEPYTQRRDGQAVTSLTQRARRHVGANLVFQFAEGYGVSLDYRHGSLPPAFERVEHRLALSLTLQRKHR